MTELVPSASHDSNVVPIRTALSEYWQRGATGQHHLDDGQAPALADLDTRRAIPFSADPDLAIVRTTALAAFMADRSQQAHVRAAEREAQGLTLAGSDGYEPSVVPLHRNDNPDA